MTILQIFYLLKKVELISQHLLSLKLASHFSRMKLSGPIIRKPVQSYKLSTHYQYYGAIYKMFSLYIKNRFLVYYDLWEYHHNYWYPLLWQGFTRKLDTTSNFNLTIWNRYGKIFLQRFEQISVRLPPLV